MLRSRSAPLTGPGCETPSPSRLTRLREIYQVDARDRVVELSEVPQSSVGAPLPVVLADEHSVLLAYLAEERDPAWDGTTIREVTFESAEPAALVRFERTWSFQFGAPNDEAFRGHALHDRGLHPYAAFEVEHSSWLRGLERMNSVHEHHRPADFLLLRHYIFAFHDSTFECAARGFTVERRDGPLADVVADMPALLART
jgi:hypothetical protein